MERECPLERHINLSWNSDETWTSKGTVLKRMMKCGKAQCACASDATKRYGPYFELTYKANSKTVNVKSSHRKRLRCTAAAQPYRKLKTLLNRLDKPSKTILRHLAKLAESKRQD